MGQVSAPRLISSALALAALTLAGCSAPTGTPLPPGTTAVSGRAGPGGIAASAMAPRPRPTVLSADAYGVRLAALAGPVRRAITAMAGAHSVKALDQRLTTAEQLLTRTSEDLKGLLAPLELQAQHAAYLESLADLANEMGATQGRLGARDVCTASGAVADLATPLRSLDAAGEALGRMGARAADVVTVKVGEKLNRRLANGRFLYSEPRTGQAYLQIENGDRRDAVVTVRRGNTTVFSVSVRRRSKVTVGGIGDGNYRVYYTHGSDWDTRAGSFSRDCRFERFVERARFKTTYTPTQLVIQDWAITLHGTADGKAGTKDVDPSEFPIGTKRKHPRL